MLLAEATRGRVTSHMTPAVFAIPGDIKLPTGGYAYDRRVLALLPQFGIAFTICSCRGRFPNRAPPTSTATAGC